MKSDAAVTPLGEELHTDGNRSDDPHSETTASGKKSCLFRVTENITVAPRCRHITIGKRKVENYKNEFTTIAELLQIELLKTMESRLNYKYSYPE